MSELHLNSYFLKVKTNASLFLLLLRQPQHKVSVSNRSYFYRVAIPTLLTEVLAYYHAWALI